jgi:aspartate/methionine/tyrosine aminotransferase
MSSLNPPPKRISRLHLPEADLPRGSLREAERQLAASVPMEDGVVDLTYADTRRFPPPDWHLDEFVRSAGGSGKTYTPYRGDSEVRAQVARNVGQFLGVDVDPETELILTPGSQAGLYHALAGIIEEDDVVAIGDPDYLTTERMVRYFGADVVHVPLQWQTNEQGLDLDVLEQVLATRRPRLLVFSNPNNPTGAVASPDNVKTIAELVLRHDMLVLVDELYSRLVYDGQPFAHLAAQQGMRERCVTLLGPSKTESLSGYRIGVAVAPPVLVDRMEDLLAVSTLRAPAYAQHLLARWLSDDRDYVARRIQEYQDLRDQTLSRLDACEVLTAESPRGSAYVFPSFSGLDLPDQEILQKLQVEARVVVNPGYQFGPRGARHMRICFAQDEVVWDHILDRVIKSLEGMRT